VSDSVLAPPQAASSEAASKGPARLRERSQTAESEAEIEGADMQVS
jgi:hypothetical protein